MRISRSSSPHESIGYHLLPNSKVDVFLRRNEVTEIEIDDEGNESTVYVAEEVYLQVEPSVTKVQVESNFDYYWNKTESQEPTQEDRLVSLENTMLALMME